MKRLQNYANIPRYQSLREAGAGFAQFFSTQHCGQIMFRKSRKSSKIKKDLTALISAFAKIFEHCRKGFSSGGVSGAVPTLF